MSIRFCVLATAATFLLGSSAFAASRALVVYDASNNEIGPVIGAANGEVTVILTRAGNFFVATLAQNDFDLQYSSLYFGSTDCSGSPYLGDVPGGALLPVAIYTGVYPTYRVYIPDFLSPKLSLAHSYRSSTGTCRAVSSEAFANLTPAVLVGEEQNIVKFPITVRYQ